jgi:DNA-binding transcriptional MerR regulator
MADEQAESSEQKLYTLTEVSKKTGISMPTLQRYKKSYQDRIPSVGKGRTQRYPEESLPVFKQIKKENIKRRGRPPKSESKKKAAAKPKKKSKEGLLTLTKIAEETGISYPTLVRYVKLYKDRIPHKGSGRSRRFYPEAIEVFKQIRSESPRGRRKKKASAPARASRATATSATDAGLARRLDALERSNADLEKQIRQLVKELKKPLKLTIKR